MDARQAFADLLEVIAQVLAAEGFARQGQTFHRRQGKNWQVINFQKSVASSADRVVFTINLGIASARLSAFFGGKDTKRKPKSDDCQWRKRIGQLLPERQDVWWTIDASASVEGLILEILAAISRYALPALERYASDEALRDLWLSDGSQQFGYLAVLLKALGPPERLEGILEEWRRLVAGRPGAVLVEHEIARLSQEKVL